MLPLRTLLRPAALRLPTRKGYATTSSPGEKDYMMYYVGGGAAALLGLWYFTRDPEVKGEMKRVATK